MAIYDLRCGEGHRFEVIQSFTAPLPDCPRCGAQTVKIPSRFALTGRAAPPPPPEAMPQTWRGTYGADREYVAELRRTTERRRGLEEKYPELTGDRRPIMAHEGRYEQAPLRAGDPVPTGRPHHPSGPGHGDGHSHGHSHSHSHGHGHGHGDAGGAPGRAEPLGR